MRNPVLDTIALRRSVRKYQTKQVQESALQQILEAGRCAPSGHNNQTTHLLVIQHSAVLDELAQTAERSFAAIELQESMYISLQGSIRASKRGGYRFHYDAPTLIVVANRKGYGNAMADSSCVLENMMIAATALGVGSCWINQLHWLDKDASIRGILECLGLAKEETICGALALGYPQMDNAFHEKPATGNPVTFIRA